jgi:hypothetical protein
MRVIFWRFDTWPPWTYHRSAYISKYLYISPIQIGDSEIWVEFDSLCLAFFFDAVEECL